MRLKSTGDYPFHERVLSSYENGFDEGPVAKTVAYGGCLTAILAVAVGILGAISGLGYGIWLFVAMFL
jgi:hypothetical protein